MFELHEFRRQFTEIAPADCFISTFQFGLPFVATGHPAVWISFEFTAAWIEKGRHRLHLRILLVQTLSAYKPVWLYDCFPAPPM